MTEQVQQAPQPDVSVILTAHDETLVCGPTIQAAEVAIAQARDAGFTLEPLIVLDAATPETMEWFNQPALDGWTRLELEERDLGRARNTAIKRSTGAFIAFLDADDLISENWLAEGARLLSEARATGKKRIVHPELNWLFDGGKSVYFNPDQDDALFTPWYFYAMNYYDSMCMAPREAHETIAYASRDIPNGLSYQDWQFSVETMAAGWRHVSARDTVIFKRRRDVSLVTESQGRKAVVRALEPMAIDRIAHLGAPFSREPMDRPGALSRLTSWTRKALGPGEIEGPERGVPHSGRGLSERIDYAKTRAERDAARDIRGYERVARSFDLAYYLSQYPDLAHARRVDPVGHFIRRGVTENRQPLHYFSNRHYLRRHPEAADDPAGPFHHYLSKGRSRGHVAAPFTRFEELAEIIERTPRKAQALIQTRYDDIRQRLEHGRLGEVVNKAACFEPLISGTWPNALGVRIPPFHSDIVVSRVAAMHALCNAAGLTRARVVICVNRSRWGGARRMEGHIAHALCKLHRPEDIVMLSTDGSGDLPEGRLPDGVRYVDFANLIAPLTGDEAQRVLVQFLRALRPDAVFNVNSRLMWQALTSYGRAMKTSFRMIGCLFCNEQTVLGHATGYPLTQVYRHFETLHAIATDSHDLAQTIIRRHMISGANLGKIRVLSAPVDPTLPVVEAPAVQPGRRAQVFWSGRCDAQKRIDLVYAIASACPDVDFRVWGEVVMGSERALPVVRPDNVIHEGKYATFTDLPLQEADAWLYTAAWDGVPSILLEVAMTGIPLFGTNVGGTAEVLQDGLTGVVPSEASTRDYVDELRKILADPAGARERAGQLRQRLISERTDDAYEAELARLLE